MLSELSGIVVSARYAEMQVQWLQRVRRIVEAGGTLATCTADAQNADTLRRAGKPRSYGSLRCVYHLTIFTATLCQLADIIHANAVLTPYMAVAYSYAI